MTMEAAAQFAVSLGVSARPKLRHDPPRPIELGVAPARFSRGPMSYVGEVDARGNPHGHGRLELPPSRGGTLHPFGEGHVYEGQFAAGAPEGHGRKEWEDGTWYEGQWRRGEVHGRGVYHWGHDGAECVGEFDAHGACGHCTYTYGNGNFYRGQMQRGQKHGCGWGWSPNGQLDAMRWVADRPVGEGVVWLAPDRSRCMRLLQGMPQGNISLEEAARIQATFELVGEPSDFPDGVAALGAAGQQFALPSSRGSRTP